MRINEQNNLALQANLPTKTESFNRRCLRAALPMVALVTLFSVSQLQAGSIYTFSGTVSGDAESASVEFDVSSCVASGCQLNIIITNNVSNPANIAYGILGLSFNIGSLTSPGALKVDGSNVAEVTNGPGGPVTSVSYPAGSTTPTNLAPNWSFSYLSNNNGCTDSNVFCLGGHTSGGQPTDLIIGDGPYTAGDSSLAQHSSSTFGTSRF